MPLLPGQQDNLEPIKHRIIRSQNRLIEVKFILMIILFEFSVILLVYQTAENTLELI